jgi:oligoendopeptidase F
MIQKDPQSAWERYMAYTRPAGTMTYTQLLQQAGLRSPFDSSLLQDVCSAAEQWLQEYDLSGIA